MRLIGAICLVMLCGFFSVASAVNYPQHQGRMVNDFVGKLDAQSKERIEKTLRDFEKRTTAEIAVAIVPDLQGETVETYAVNLFAKWGVGKKGKDNGVLLLISMKERKSRIEVGYGLEGDLTDATSGRIIRGKLVPALKSGNFATGVEQAVVAIMNTITPPLPKTLTPEEKKRVAEQHRAAYQAMIAQQKVQQQREEKLIGMIKTDAVAIAFLGIFVGLGIFAKKKLTERRLRRKRIENERVRIVSSLTKSAEAVRTTNADAVKLTTEMDVLPNWAKKEMESRLHAITDLRNNISANCEKAEKMIKAGDDQLETAREAVSLIGRQVSDLKDAQDEANDMVTSIKAKLAESKEMLVSLTEQIADIEKLGQKMKAEGYRIGIDEQLQREQKSLDACTNEMEKNACVYPILGQLEGVAEHLAKLRKGLEGLSAMHIATKQAIAGLSERISMLETTVAETVSLMHELKQGHPENVWLEVSGLYGTIPDTIEQARKWASEAEEKNSMQTQQFVEAANIMQRANVAITNASDICKEIRNLHAEVHKAKEDFPSLLAGAESAVEKASKLIGHRDVASSRKGALAGASQKIQEVKSMAGKGGLIDWLAVTSLLLSASVTAKDVATSAQRDIDAAAEAIRRALAAKKAEEERLARKRQNDEDEERRQSLSYSSSSYDSSSCGSSDSSSDFGGGSSGGGGASGDW